jgi:DNA invertase Pin-like site-specific DNA recombinase
MGEAAGRWIRVSTGGQNEGSQIPDIDAWCASHGYEVAETYTLHGKSASKGEQQPMIDAMLADMHAGVIKVLVVWKSDRIERRGPRFVFNLLWEIQNAGGRVEFVTEPYLNVTGPGQELMLTNMSVLAREESRTKSDRTRINRATIAGNGAFAGRAPWGMVTTGEKYHKGLALTDAGRKYLPEIYNRVADGASLGEVAAWLFRQHAGCPSPGDPHICRAWWERSIGGIIRNPAYRGSYCGHDGRELYRLPESERAVDASLWKRANDSLDSRPQRGKANPEGRAMLAEALFCPKCDGPMYRLVSRNYEVKNKVKTGRVLSSYTNYRCSGKGPQRKSACKNSVDVVTVDTLVDAAMREIHDHIVRTEFVPGHNHQAEIDEIGYQLRQLPLRGLDEDAEDAERARLRAEKRRLASLPATADEWVPVDTGVSYADQWAAQTPQQRGDWLRSKGVRIYASKDTSALPALVEALTGKLAKRTAERFAVKTDGTVTVAIYYGVLGSALAA